MRRLVALVGLAAIGLALFAAPAGAATGITSRLQLRGHLPELGERPVLRVFQTQAAYDSFRTSLGEANVFPAPANMFMSFDTEILALYARGNDAGGRCLRTGPSATLDGDTATLDLLFESGTCGAPSSAHYPFVLVSLSRTAADGSSWVTPARSVCGSAPGVSDSRACASLGTTGTTPSPALTTPPTAATTAPPTAATTAPPTGTAAASPTATRTASPTTTAAPTVTASPSPTRSPVAVASPTAGATAAAAPAASDGNSDFLVTAGLVALGVLIGIVIMAARRPRRSIRRIP